MTLEGVSHVEEEVSEIFRRISSGRRVNDEVSGGRFAMKMYRENIAQYLLLTWKESPRPLFHPNVVVDHVMRVYSHRVLLDPFHSFRLGTFAYGFYTVLGLLFNRCKLLLCNVKLAPRHKDLFTIRKVEDHIALLFHALWVKFDPADLWVIHREHVNREILEPFLCQEQLLKTESMQLNLTVSQLNHR